MTPTAKGARTPKGAEPARRERDRRALFVSAGLSQSGGGIAAAARLQLASVQKSAGEPRRSGSARITASL
jgi:hypothetical protein